MRNEDEFYNLLTGKRMTAYLNGKFQKHFHHLEYTPHDNESYLHETAKEVFEDTYSNCLKTGQPFYLEFYKAVECRNHYKQTGVICSLGDKLETFDLTREFKVIKVEKKFDELKPDIQLISLKDNKDKEVIFIEIYVTHKSTEKKINKGQRIIEIKINSEDDILRLRRTKLSVIDKKSTFFNFKKTLMTMDFCSQHERGCREFIDTFILHKNGSYAFLNETLENTLSHVAGEENKISKVFYKPFDKFDEQLTDLEKKQKFVQSLVEQNYKLKDCGYCRYVGDKMIKGKKVGLFCKFLTKRVENNTAWDCEYYRKK